MHTFEEFTKLFQTHIYREGSDKLLEWITNSDFSQAPASTRFHGNYPGGLCHHSVNVYYELQRLLKAYPEIQCSEETAAIISLLHDSCKINFYEIEYRNKKINGEWQSVPTYTINEKFCYGGHGSKSVFIIQNYIRLTPEEAVAIHNHMGAFDNQNVGKTYERYPLAWILHVADESAGYLIESKNEKENEIA